jgi:hypothetical protein
MFLKRFNLRLDLKNLLDLNSKLQPQILNPFYPFFLAPQLHFSPIFPVAHF